MCLQDNLFCTVKQLIEPTCFQDLNCLKFSIVTCCHSGQGFKCKGSGSGCETIYLYVYLSKSMFTLYHYVFILFSDNLSLIKQTQIGLGRSPRDTYILEWQNLDEFSNISYAYRVPDGVPVWVKIRIINNGKAGKKLLCYNTIFTESHLESAVFVLIHPIKYINVVVWDLFEIMLVRLFGIHL